MNAAQPFKPHTVIRPLGWLAISLVAFMLCSFLFIQSFWQYEIDVAKLKKPDDSTLLLQRLDSLDIDYRIGKDGTVKVSSYDRERLKEAGVEPIGGMSSPSYFYQAVLLVVLILLAVVVMVMGRTVYALLKQGVFGIWGPEVAEDDVTFIKTVSEGKRDHGPSESSQIPKSEWQGLLEDEHPQSIAIYLLGLDSEAAAEALEVLSEDIRDAVWERMALSGACTPELENALQMLYSRKRKALQRRSRPAERTEKMAAIFKLLSADTRRLCITALKKANPEDPLIGLLETES